MLCIQPFLQTTALCKNKFSALYWNLAGLLTTFLVATKRLYEGVSVHRMDGWMDGQSVTRPTRSH